MNFPGDEREQIRRQRLRLGELDCGLAAARPAPVRLLGAVGDGLPAGRDVERQAYSAPSGRADRNRECQARPRRHEQRVEELVVAIERRVAGNELELDAIGSRARRLRGNDDVSVDEVGAGIGAVDRNAANALSWLREVEDET